MAEWVGASLRRAPIELIKKCERGRYRRAAGDAHCPPPDGKVVRDHIATFWRWSTPEQQTVRDNSAWKVGWLE